MKRYKIKIKNPVMAVPITFLYKYCPKQFRIVGIMTGSSSKDFVNGNDNRKKFYINSKGVYARVIIEKI